MSDEPTQQEKLEALRNDTNFSWQQNAIDDPGGRFQKLTPTTVTGSANSSLPRLPESSPWSSPDPSGPEPPLGYSVDQMDQK